MSSVSASGGSSGKKIGVIVLAVIAVLLIALGIMYFIEPAHSLIIGKITAPPKRADGHRPLWGVASLVLAVIFLAGAWFVGRTGKSATSSTSAAVGADR